jgi:LVIVD repeat
MRIQGWLLKAPLLALCVCVGSIAIASSAFADHATRPHTPNIDALGHSPDFGSFLLPDGQSDANSDLAFRDNLAFHGDYDGFRIVDITDPNNPVQVSRTRCNGDQGDIVVWNDVLVRAWNSPKSTNRLCDGTFVPPGFEGMHVFDISNLNDPQLVDRVELSARPQAESPGCGTHTLTLAPNGDSAVIYNATSGGNDALRPHDRHCDWIDIVQVQDDPDAPPAASFVRREPLEGDHAAHDNGVILGSVNKLATASGHMSNVFSIGGPNGGSLLNPAPLFTIEEEGVCNKGKPTLCNGNWHSAAFDWQGDVIIMGWEPGGGVAPECEATDPDVKKSAFFYNADTGAKLGQWTLPRPQNSAENCTIHNYNTVPLTSGRDVLVLGNYQAGTWVVDFSNPADAETVAFSDPPPLVPTQLGGAWSSYWYNGFIYESEITKGLNVFGLNDGTFAGAAPVTHLNPQTQEFSLP